MLSSSALRTPVRGSRRAVRRALLGAAAAVLAAGLVTGPAAAPAAANPSRTDASTGYITDISPHAISSVLSLSGDTTVFVRGTDNHIWYRTGYPGGSWTAWAAIPHPYARSGPAAISSDGETVQVYIRGYDDSVMYASASLDPTTGAPGAWSSWGYEPVFGQGRTTAAPGMAEIDPTLKAAVVRGRDGALWYAVYDVTATPSSWSAWTPLGGRAHSAPTIEVDLDGAEAQYIVSVVGSDGRLWRIPVSADRDAPGALGGWTGGQRSSTLGPATLHSHSWTWPFPRLLALGGPHRSILMVDPDTGTTYSLGASGTSPAHIAPQGDGTMLVFVRGNDRSLWVNHTDLHDQSGWTYLSGVLG